MNVMGLHKNPILPKTPGKHRASMNPLQRAETPQNIHSDETETPTQADNPLAESFESTASTPAGRSPKRPRGIPSSQDATPVPPRSISTQKTKTLPTRTRTGQQERKPLADGNRNSQRKSQSHEAKGRNSGVFYESQVAPRLDENHLQDLDLDTDLEFSKDFIFTSTCLSEGNGN